MNRAADVMDIDAEAGDERDQYLCFRMGAEAYGVGILAVREILEYGPLTVVPLMPEYVRGVLNLRGRVVPVVDLALRFGGPATVPTRRTCIVIMQVTLGETMLDVGVLVDAVSQVVEIAPEDIAPAPAFGTGIDEACIHGLGRLDGRFVILLDVARVLAEDLARIGGLAADPARAAAA